MAAGTQVEFSKEPTDVFTEILSLTSFPMEKWGALF